MTKFRYLVESREGSLSENYLDALGNEGWELVAVTYGPDGIGPGAFQRFYFKRPIEELTPIVPLPPWEPQS